MEKVPQVKDKLKTLNNRSQKKRVTFGGSIINVKSIVMEVSSWHKEESSEGEFLSYTLGQLHHAGFVHCFAPDAKMGPN